MARAASSVFRARSVSSTRRTKVPPVCFAWSQLNNAVRAPPMWRYPVGDGAKRTRIGEVIGVMEWRSNGVMSLLVHYSNTPLLQHSRSRLLDEQFPGAAASVTIVRQIRLGHAGVRRYEG